MKAPIIGITSTLVKIDEMSEGVYVHQDYHKAIQACGGLPMILPLTDETSYRAMIDRCDALIISGGEDVDPLYFDAEPHPGLGKVFPLRDRLEIDAIRYARTLDKPLLAICRGVQVLNVAFGGTLIQDIPAQCPGSLQHSQKRARSLDSHWVEIHPQSRLFRIFGSEKVRVNSLHHQSVEQVADGFITTAVASDGIIEGIEDPKARFFMGVQWHPESMHSHDPLMLALFDSLVKEGAKTPV